MALAGQDKIIIIEFSQFGEENEKERRTRKASMFNGKSVICRMLLTHKYSFRGKVDKDILLIECENLQVSY